MDFRLGSQEVKAKAKDNVNNMIYRIWWRRWRIWRIRINKQYLILSNIRNWSKCNSITSKISLLKNDSIITSWYYSIRCIEGKIKFNPVKINKWGLLDFKRLTKESNLWWIWERLKSWIDCWAWSKYLWYVFRRW